MFHQTIVLTDGSTFKVMSSSPRKTYRLTRDKFNNPLWTGRRRSADEDEQNQQLSKFRKSFTGAIGGEASLRELAARRLQKDGTQAASSGDARMDAADALFSMLENDDAYKPTKGREKGESAAAPAKKKGVRT